MVRDGAKKFIKELNRINPGSIPTYKLFNGWLDLLFYSLVNANHKIKFCEFNPEYSKEYEYALRAIHPLKEQALRPLLEILIEEYTESPRDLLGEIVSELSLLDVGGMGQVFTPFELCELIARMNFPQGHDEYENYNIYKKLLINEPAVGAGAMIIAAYKQFKTINFTPDKWAVYANDIDMKCVKMSFIQFNLLDIPAVVYRLDTLREPLTQDNFFTGYPTFCYLRYNEWRLKPTVQEDLSECEPLKRRKRTQLVSSY